MLVNRSKSVNPPKTLIKELDLAYLLLRQNKIKEAKEKFMLIRGKHKLEGVMGISRCYMKAHMIDETIQLLSPYMNVSLIFSRDRLG